MPTEERPTSFDRVPGAPCGRMLLLAALLFLVLATGAEWYWRAQGFRPSVTDGEALWCAQRDRVDGPSPRTVVVLGRSRIQQAFVPEVFREVCAGYETVQLAVGGQHPVGTLFHFADETEFAGVLLVSVTGPSLLAELWHQQQGYLDYHARQWGPFERQAQRVRAFAQTRLALLAPELSLREVLPRMLRGGVPSQFLRVSAERHHRVDYRKAPLEEFRLNQLETIRANMARYTALEGYARWPRGVRRIEDRVRRIQQRGGRVVFIRMPTSGAYHEAEERDFPREAFWDVWASRTSAVAIHYRDVPGMAEMECAEGTHLHLEDTERFTRLLAGELIRRGVLEPR